MSLYATASISNLTSRDLQVSFCSTNVSIPWAPSTVQAQSAAKSYKTEIGQRQQEVTAPYADSHGDGCAKMVGVSGENVESQIPLLGASDLATTKNCYDGNQYTYVDANQSCPIGFRALNQSSVACK